MAHSAQCALVHIAMEDNGAISGNGRSLNKSIRASGHSSHTLEDSEQVNTTIRRSGSWSGVNESEEGKLCDFMSYMHKFYRYA